MRRLLVLPLLASAFAFSAPASADDVPCYGAHAGNARVGVCAGVVCVDLCGPRPVVHGDCAGVPAVVLAVCNFRLGR